MKSTSYGLILDVETYDDGHQDVAENGCVLFSWEEPVRLISCFSYIPAPLEGAWNKEHVKIHNITPDLYTDSIDFRKQLQTVISLADVYIAHNASFDYKRLVAQGFQFKENTPWVCTVHTYPWANPPHSYRLLDITHHQGSPVHGTHRAVVDCLALFYALKREPSLRDRLMMGTVPSPLPNLYELRLPTANQFSREKLYEMGYRWKKISGKWRVVCSSYKTPEVYDLKDTDELKEIFDGL